MSLATTTLISSEHTARRPLDVQVRITIPVLLLVLAGLSLLIDMPVARFFLTAKTPKTLVDLLKNAETFGHAAGVALIAVTILCVDPQGLLRAANAALCAIAGGLSANVVKLLIGRVRPQSLDLATVDLSATFSGLFRFAAGGSAHQSFPSAHTATAVGLAVALAAAYPRARVWFFVLAGLVGLQRIQTSAHYPSDVFAGAVVGWIAAQTVLLLRQPNGHIISA